MDRLAFGRAGCVHRAEFSRLTVLSEPTSRVPSWVGVLLLATAAVRSCPGSGAPNAVWPPSWTARPYEQYHAQFVVDCLGGAFCSTLGWGGLGPIRSPRSGFYPSSSSKRARGIQRQRLRLLLSPGCFRESFASALVRRRSQAQAHGHGSVAVLNLKGGMADAETLLQRLAGVTRRPIIDARLGTTRCAVSAVAVALSGQIWRSCTSVTPGSAAR